MKHKYLIFIFIASFVRSSCVLAQDGTLIDPLGGVKADAAVFEAKSTNQGMLVPRVTLTALNTFNPPISSGPPVTSLLIYNSAGALPVGYYYWDGSSWQRLVNGNGSFPTGSGTPDYLARWITGSTLGTGITYDNGASVGIGSTSPGGRLDVNGGALVLSNAYLDINRDAYARSGISWYSQAYPSWSTYMSPGGQTSTGPHGDLTAPSGTFVTSWAHRNYIEDAGGYGWTFESAANTTTPAVKFEIRSSDGLFHSYGNGIIDGSVGIGSNAPVERLDVSGNARATGIMYWGNAGTRTETRDDAGTMGGKSGYYETSTPAPAADWYTGASSWQHLLETRHSNTGNNYAMQFAGSFFDQNLWFRKTNNSPTTAWSRILTTNDLSTLSGTTNYLARWTSATALGIGVAYDDGTNVGIGSTVPGQKLDVAGNIKANEGFLVETTVASGFYDSDAAQTPYSRTHSDGFHTNGLGDGQLFLEGRAIDANTYISIGGGLAGGQLANNVILASATTNVGIGSVSPTQKLDVAGNTTSHIYYDRDNTGYYADPHTTSRMSTILLDRTYGAYNHFTYGGVFAGDWQSLTNTAGQLNYSEVHNINAGAHSNQPPGVYTYGGVLSLRGDNHSFQLYASHTGDLSYKTQWGNDNYSGWRQILTSSNVGTYGIQNQYAAPQAASFWISGNAQVGSNFTNLGGRLLTSHDAGWLVDGSAPQMVISSSYTDTRHGFRIGLDLHNDDATTYGSYSPAIMFSRRGASTSYNSAIAGIAAQAEGQGGDPNWVYGSLVFYTAHQTGYGLSERMRIDQTGQVGIGVVSPQGQVHSKGMDRIMTTSQNAANTPPGPGGGTFMGGGDGCPWCGQWWTSYSTIPGAGVGEVSSNTGGRAGGLFYGGVGEWVGGGGAGLFAQGGDGSLHGFGGVGIYAKGGSHGGNVAGGRQAAGYFDGNLLTSGGLVVGSAYSLNALRNTSYGTVNIPAGNVAITGNVGIGTTNPHSSFEIAKTPIGGNSYYDGILIGQANGDNSQTIQTYIDDGAGGGWGNWGYAGGCCNPLLLQPNSGNVGIATTNPGHKLEVGGNVSAHVFYDRDNNSYYANPAGYSNFNQLNISRDGAGECCSGGVYTLSLAESTSGSGRMAGIQFHNGGVSEGYLRLANGGSRRIQLGDYQSVGMGLEMTGDFVNQNVEWNQAAGSGNYQYVGANSAAVVVNNTPVTLSKPDGNLGNNGYSTVILIANVTVSGNDITWGGGNGSNGSVNFLGHGQAGYKIYLQRSTDNATWTTLTTGAGTAGIQVPDWYMQANGITAFQTGVSADAFKLSSNVSLNWVDDVGVGTYYYRLVFEPTGYNKSGGNYLISDRALTVMQMKR